jgi:hypothetical protein
MGRGGRAPPRPDMPCGCFFTATSAGGKGKGLLSGIPVNRDIITEKFL